MAVKNLEKNTDKDLLKNLKSKREDLRKFRFGIAGSKKRDIKVGKNLRKQIAQILTELNSRNK